MVSLYTPENNDEEGNSADKDCEDNDDEILQWLLEHKMGIKIMMNLANIVAWQNKDEYGEDFNNELGQKLWWKRGLWRWIRQTFAMNPWDVARPAWA